MTCENLDFLKQSAVLAEAKRSKELKEIIPLVEILNAER
jgi:hypothetical protein